MSFDLQVPFLGMGNVMLLRMQTSWQVKHLVAPQADDPRDRLVGEFEDRGVGVGEGGARTGSGRGGFGGSGGGGRLWW